MVWEFEAEAESISGNLSTGLARVSCITTGGRAIKREKQSSGMWLSRDLEQPVNRASRGRRAQIRPMAVSQAR